MPIEIRELVIRATVDPAAAAGGSAAASPPQGLRGTDASAHGSSSDDMVQTCVREVLRILEEKQER